MCEDLQDRQEADPLRDQQFHQAEQLSVSITKQSAPKLMQNGESSSRKNVTIDGCAARGGRGPTSEDWLLHYRRVCLGCKQIQIGQGQKIRLTSISPHGTSLRTFQQVMMVQVEHCLNAPARAATARAAVPSPFFIVIIVISCQAGQQALMRS